MPVLDAGGMPVRKIQDDQIIMAINTISQRNQAQQIQIMQLGLLVEFLIEKFSAITLADGQPLFAIDDKEFEEFSKRRYDEIKAEASEFSKLMQEQKQTGAPVNLQE